MTDRGGGMENQREIYTERERKSLHRQSGLRFKVD